MEGCRICPRACMADRDHGQKGYCGQTYELYVARAALHMWEEPCLSAKGGAGTVFFSGCNLRCIYCQNHEIAAGHAGKAISIERLSEIFLELQRKGAKNIDLVTPSHYTPAIREALLLARQGGLRVPVVYNCGGYESVETIKSLEGLIDIWMPDFKYADAGLAKSFSMAEDYEETAKRALAEMVRQKPQTVFDGDGCMKEGVLVRHLVLPGHINNSKKVLSYLWETYKDRICVSIMSQYTPVRESKDYPELNRSLTKREYEKVLAHALKLGFTNAYIQEGRADKKSFIPAFDLTGV